MNTMNKETINKRQIELLLQANEVNAKATTHMIAVGTGYNTSWIPSLLGGFHFMHMEDLAPASAVVMSREDYTAKTGEILSTERDYWDQEIKRSMGCKACGLRIEEAICQFCYEPVCGSCDGSELEDAA